MPYKNTEKQKQYQHNWYLKDKDISFSRRQTNRLKHKAKSNKLASRFKLRYGCANCGYRRCAQALEFHHVEPMSKTMTVAQLIIGGYNLNKVKEEIRKCIILCANCHRELHSGFCSLMD